MPKCIQEKVCISNKARVAIASIFDAEIINKLDDAPPIICQRCFGWGVISFERVCPECNGSGKTPSAHEMTRQSLCRIKSDVLLV